jgi:hypothetical protein
LAQRARREGGIGRAEGCQATREMGVDAAAHRLHVALLLVAVGAAALAGGAASGADSGGPLLACGTAGNPGGDSTQVIQVFEAVAGVCAQVGETVAPGGLLPISCASFVCQRVVRLASDSCAAAFARDGFLSAAFKPQLDPLTALCHSAAAAIPAPPRIAVTDPASGPGVSAAAVGATLTDGMGAGGRNSTTAQDFVTFQAKAGEIAALTLVALYLADVHDYVIVYVDSKTTHLIRLGGTALPPLAEGNRTYRSRPGGYITLRTYRDPDSGPGHAGFFSFRVACSGDASCSSHGSCDAATSTCVCQSGWAGADCGACSVHLSLSFCDSYSVSLSLSSPALSAPRLMPLLCLLRFDVQARRRLRVLSRARASCWTTRRGETRSTPGRREQRPSSGRCATRRSQTTRARRPRSTRSATRTTRRWCSRATRWDTSSAAT